MTTRELLVEPNPVVAAMEPYTGAPPNPLIELKLDSNESASPLEPLRRPPDGGAQWHPNRYQRTATLEARIADLLDVDPDQVLVTAGADDALERAIRMMCAPGREAILTVPTFEVLERYVRLAGGSLVKVPWWQDDFPIDKVCSAAGTNTALVVVVSPNNPTGAVASGAALTQLAASLPRTLILLDHAYVEFADPTHDLTRTALDMPNVLVFRTFSKAWGAAGLRVGYVVGDRRVVRWLRTLGQPYPVAAPSLEMAMLLLQELDSPPAECLETVRRLRQDLTGVLKELRIEALPSNANFVLARFSDPAWVREALVSLGIGVRPFPGRGELEHWLRITVPGDDETFARLASGLRTVLAPEALLFDLDGVIADVSGSYRDTIVGTAASFGVTISPADISRTKAAGNANNDWELSLRLLGERGQDRHLAEVQNMFEELYQGTADRPGLRRNETLLINREVLHRLADRLPLAIVTGRPRYDAERFLDEHGVTEYFAAVVTMEDAPAKPDPAPVRVALERLGVRNAWMVGDTPDDVCAARAAEVLPIGSLAPGEDEITKTVLISAGAARVLASVNELEEVLP